MKKIVTIIAFFSVTALFAQHEVAKKIQELEGKRISFKSVAVLNEIKNASYNDLQKEVTNATVARINTTGVNDIVTHNYDFIEVAIPYNGSQVVVDLFRVDVFAEGFHVDTNQQKNITYQKGVYYRGSIKGNYNSVASFNFFNNALNGIISSDALANLVVGKLNKKDNTNDYVVYSDAHLKIMNDFNCATKDNVLQPVATQSTHRNATSTRCASFYFEIDNNLYQNNSSDTTTTTNWMTSVFNNVQTLYANDGISVAIKSIYIWTTQDPYEGIGTSSIDYLTKFNAVRPVFDGDVGQLIGIDPGALGGLAITVNGMCSQNNYCYADVNFSYATVPTYSWTVEVITHEFGHLLGAPHTHACVWNGNNTAIDNCAAASQGSSAEGYSCITSPLTLPSNGGTIMSYCHLVNGVGINFNNGFGTQPTNRILNTLNGSACLSTDCINTCINTLSSVAIQNVTTSSATINFVDSGTTFTSWQIAVYPFGDTPSSWVTVTSNSYVVSGLNPDTYYVAEVRPDCSSVGLTSGGNRILFVTAASFCNGIVFADSGGTTGNYGNLETVVRTIIPDVPNNKIVLTFSDFNFEQDYDYLYVYDGNSTAAPLLNVGGSTGTTVPGPFTSSAADGSLTVEYISDQYVNYSGFIATISCASTLGSHQNEVVDFSYFPNPTNGTVSIVSKTPIHQVSVYNVTGQLLYQKPENDLNASVDMAAFATGTYFFKLQFEGGTEANFKVVRK